MHSVKISTVIWLALVILVVLFVWSLFLLVAALLWKPHSRRGFQKEKKTIFSRLFLYELAIIMSKAQNPHYWNFSPQESILIGSLTTFSITVQFEHGERFWLYSFSCQDMLSFFPTSSAKYAIYFPVPWTIHTGCRFQIIPGAPKHARLP